MNYVIGSLIIGLGVAALIDIGGLPTRAISFSDRLGSLRLREPDWEAVKITRIGLGVVLIVIGVFTAIG